MELGRALLLFLTIAVAGFRVYRTVLVFFYLISKKVMLLRWKGAADGLC